MNTLLWWLAQNTVSVALLTPFVWAACWLFRSRPAVQHLLWMLLLLKLVAPPLVRWPWSAHDAFSSARFAWRDDSQRIAVVTSHDATPLSVEIEAIDLLADAELAALQPTAVQIEPIREPAPADWSIYMQSAFGLWTIGALAVTGFALRCIARQSQVLRNASDPSPTLVVAVRHAAKRLRVRPVSSAFSQRVTSPLICCLGRPRLVWPDALRAPEIIVASDGIIAHELAHVARRDHLVVYLELLALALHWWNPLAWYLRRQLRETRELACDAMALAGAEQARSDYARRLLTMSTTSAQPLSLAPAFGAGTFSRRFLERRLTMVFDNRANGRLSLGGLALAATLATVALPGLSWGYQGADNAGTTAPVAGNSADAPPAPENTSDTTVTAGEGLRTVVPVLSEIHGIQELFLVSQAGSADDVAQNGIQTVNPASDGNAVLQDVTQFNALNVTQPAEQTIKLQDGSTIEIRRTDDGNLVLTVKQNGQQPQAIQLGFDVLVNKVLSKSADTAEVKFADEPTQSTVHQVLGDRIQSQLEVSQPMTVNTTQVVKDWNPNDLAAASDEDVAMLRSDVELAKVTLEEKQTEVEIAKEGGYSASRMRLAELAVKRAAIELKRCEAKLSAAMKRQEGNKNWREVLQTK